MLFSVLVPAFKGEYLNKCIDSILAQTFDDFEVVIVNDASPDNLDSIVSLFKDKRIRYYKNKENTGSFNVVDNWNICLNYAKGDFVLCMGDDDMLMPNCLSLYSIAIKNNPNIDVFHCRSFIINESSTKVSLTPSWPDYETVLDNMWHRIFNRRVQYIGDFLFRRETLIKNNGFYKLPMAWASDDITSFLAMGVKGIIHINEPVFCYRQVQITLSSSGNVLHKLEAINKEEVWYYQFVKTQNPDTEQDKVLLNSIKNELPHYFKIKRIKTIAYNGFNGNYFLKFFYWLRRRNISHLNLKELIYVTILAIKDRNAKK